ncbi:MAG: glucose-6-phosphate dehydrogenase [Oscillospiraceae bacterium]|nr:glucose-6-phosphate dehydrogenase [Oscillospiraceae bacterium]
MKKTTSQTLVIFGGSGDLTFRKLLPAVYNLYASGKFEQDLRVVAVGRRDMDSQAYQDLAVKWIREQSRFKIDEALLRQVAGQISYYRLDLQAAADYQGLAQLLQQKHAGSRLIFYYAVSPSLFAAITKGVLSAGLREASVILEKPFGSDLDNARQLNGVLEAAFGQAGVYHIDHYLGKEMVRNILSIRFHNAIFSGIWNYKHIDNIQITAAEEDGVGTRGGYYDQSGAFRDMVQNHLFQVLSVLALDEPGDMVNGGLQKAQLQVLKSLHPVDPWEISHYLVMGQYEGYRSEAKVRPDSKTATYAALKVLLDTPRWQGVPFYIRTGKKLDRRETEIIIEFKRTGPDDLPDLLVIKVQPDEGIYLRFNVKTPGEQGSLLPVHMDYCQSCNLRNYQNTPEAYERLLKACIQGDHSMFSQWDQIEASWQFANQILQAWTEAGQPLATYTPGSAGPEEAKRLLAPEQREWLHVDVSLDS